MKRLHGGRFLSHVVQPWFVAVMLVLVAQRQRLADWQPNTESVGELWLGLLRFYTEEFDFKEHVISIRQHKRLTTFEKQWTSKCIAIEGDQAALLSPAANLRPAVYLPMFSIPRSL